jgi:hypothetical protein
VEAGGTRHGCKVTDPAKLRLQVDDFADAEAFIQRVATEPLSYLFRTSIGSLLHAADDPPDEKYYPLALSRAFLIMGSKDNQAAREDSSLAPCAARAPCELFSLASSDKASSDNSTLKHASLACNTVTKPETWPQAVFHNIFYVVRCHVSVRYI